MGGSPLRILVVGAGIAGLAVARALRLAGFRPDVTEQAAARGVDRDRPLPARQRRPRAAPARPRRPGTPARAGRSTGSASSTPPATPLCEVDLDPALGRRRRVPGAAPGRTAPGAAHRRRRRRAHGAEVCTLDLLPGAPSPSASPTAPITEYDLVVGADGPRSAVRALAALGGPPRPVGQVVYRAVLRDGPPVTEWTALLGQRAGFAGGADRRRAALLLRRRGRRPSVPADPLARLRERLRRLRRAGARGAGRARDEVHVGVTDEVELGRWSGGGCCWSVMPPTPPRRRCRRARRWRWRTPWCLPSRCARAGSVEAALVAYESRRRPRTRWVRDRTRDRNRTRDVPPALRDPLLRGRGGRIFGEHYRLLRRPAVSAAV